MHEDKVFLMTLIASDFAFSRLSGNGAEEHERHAQALEKLQRAKDEWKAQRKSKKRKGETSDMSRLKMY